MKSVKYKKGFTLVELIVVIAIIAVLAAILVPTMMGMVTKARVTSANNTASELRTTVNWMLLQADAAHFGINQNKVIKFDITINTTDGNTVWTCSAAQEGTYHNGNAGGITWGTAQSYTVGSNADTGKLGEKMICQSMSERFSQMKNGSAVIVLNSGDCTFVAYSSEISSGLPEDQYPPIGTDGNPGSFDWDGNISGISPEGYIVGTSPAVVRT